MEKQSNHINDKLRIRTIISGRLRSLFIGLFLMGLMMGGPVNSQADDTIFINAGAGKHASGAVQIGLDIPWSWQYELGAGFSIGGAWEYNLEVLRWKNQLPGRAKYAYGIGFSPLLRLYYDDVFYLEGTVGAHAIINATASGHLGTVFEFGDMGGVGIQLSENVRLGYRFLHFSNAGIKAPNGGINLHMGRVEISY